MRTLTVIGCVLAALAAADDVPAPAPAPAPAKKNGTLASGPVGRTSATTSRGCGDASTRCGATPSSSAKKYSPMVGTGTRRTRHGARRAHANRLSASSGTDAPSACGCHTSSSIMNYQHHLVQMTAALARIRWWT